MKTFLIIFFGAGKRGFWRVGIRHAYIFVGKVGRMRREIWCVDLASCCQLLIVLVLDIFPSFVALVPAFLTVLQ